MLFTIPAFASLFERPGGRRTAYPGEKALFFLAVVLVCLLVGMRFRVGGDWNTYVGYLERSVWLSFQDAVTSPDPGYVLLNWVANALGADVWLVNLICGAFFSWGLFTLARAQPRPWLALVVAVPYLVVVVAMGYTRQGVAIGFAMIGLVALIRDGSTAKFVFWIIIAATFHKTAVLLIPIAALANDQGRVWTILWVGGATVVAYFVLLQGSVDSLQAGYLDAQYQSSGAAIRVAMNAVPAAILLVFSRRFAMGRIERRLWTLLAWIAIAMVPALIVSPSSTAVDRLGLYLIPLQLTVLSRLPFAFARTERDVGVILGVVLYSAAVQFVWLNFAQTAFAWVPYQFYPL